MAQELAQHEDLYADVRVHKPSDASDYVLQRLFGKGFVESPATLAAQYEGNINELILREFEGLTWEHFSRNVGGADNEYGFLGQILSRMHYQLESLSRVGRVVSPHAVVKALLDGMQINIIDRDPNLPADHPESGLPNPRLSIDILRDHWERAIDRIFNQINPSFRIADIYPNVPGALAILHIMDSLTPQQGNSFGTYLEVNWYGDIYANEKVELRNIDLLDIRGLVHGYESGRAPGADIWLGSGTLQVHDGEYQTTPGFYNRTLGELFGQWERTVVKRGIVESGVTISADKVDIKTFLPSKDGHWHRTILKADKTDVIVKNAPYGIQNAEIISLDGNVILGFNRMGESPPISVGGNSQLFAADKLYLNGSLHDSVVKHTVVEMDKTADDRIDLVEIRGDIVNCKIFDSFVLDANRIINSEIKVDTSITVRNDPAFYPRDEQGAVIEIVKGDPGNTTAILNTDIDIIETEVNNAAAGDDQFIEVVRGNIVSSNIHAPDAELAMSDRDPPADPNAPDPVYGDIIHHGKGAREMTVATIEAGNIHGGLHVTTVGPVSATGTVMGHKDDPMMLLLGGGLIVQGNAPLPQRNPDPAVVQPNYSMAYVQVELRDDSPTMTIESAGSVYGAYIGPQGRDNPAWIDITVTNGNVESSTIETYGNLMVPQGNIVNCRADNNKEKIMAADVTAMALKNSEIHILRSAEIGEIPAPAAAQGAAATPGAPQPLQDVLDVSIIKQHHGRDYFLANQPPAQPAQAGVAARQAEGVRVHGNAMRSIIHVPDMDVKVDGAFSVPGNWEYYARNRKNEYLESKGDLYIPIAAQHFEVGGHLQGIASPLADGTELANCGAEVKHLKAQSAKGIVLKGVESLELRGNGAALNVADITYAEPAAPAGRATFTVEGPVSHVTFKPAEGIVTKPSLNATGPITDSILDCHDVTATHLVRSDINGNDINASGIAIHSTLKGRTIHAADAAFNATMECTDAATIDNIVTNSNLTVGTLHARHMHGGKVIATNQVELSGADQAAFDQFAAHANALAEYQAELTQARALLMPESATIDVIHADALTLPQTFTRLTTNDLNITTGLLNAPNLTILGHVPQDMQEAKLVAPSIHVADIQNISTIKTTHDLRANSILQVRNINAGGNVDVAGRLIGIPPQPGQVTQLAGRDINVGNDIHRIDKIWARGNLHANELTSYIWLVATDAEITGEMKNRPDQKNYVLAGRLNAPNANLEDAMILLHTEGKQSHIGAVAGSTVIHAPYIREWMDGVNPDGSPVIPMPPGINASGLLPKHFTSTKTGKPDIETFEKLRIPFAVNDENELLGRLGLVNINGISEITVLDFIRERARLAFESAENVLPDGCFEHWVPDATNPDGGYMALDHAGKVTIDHVTHLDTGNGAVINSHVIGQHLALDDLRNSYINTHMLDGVFEPQEGGVLVEPLTYMAIAADNDLPAGHQLEGFCDAAANGEHNIAGVIAIRKGANPNAIPADRLITDAADIDYLQRASVLPAGQMDDYDLVTLAMYEGLQKDIGAAARIVQA